MRRRLLTVALVAASASAFVIGPVAAAAQGQTAQSAPAAQPASWSSSLADVPAAQALGHAGKGVVVAVVDSWVDPTHPEFGGRVLAGADCVTGTCTAGPPPADTCGHGTHVAGIVASADYGVAPDATILPVQVLAPVAGGGPCQATVAAAAAGITWAAAHGAQVINLSVGGGAAPAAALAALADAVHAAAAQGIVVVVAAGNDGATAATTFGGDALLVAAVGRTGALASYSDRDGGVSVAAAGGDSGGAGCVGHDDQCVLSTWLDHAAAYAQGTSEAAPQVAGIAALLLAQTPGRGRAGVVAAIESTATPLADAGHGLVDAGAALRLHIPHAIAVEGVSVTSTIITDCPRSVTIAPHARAVVRCRSSRRAGGQKVTLGVPQGRGYRTVATFRTAPDGSVRLLSARLTRTTKLRIAIGSRATYVTVVVR